MDNPKSLIPKFFGVHKLHFTSPKMVTNIGTEKVYFCVMSNIFGSELEVHEMYDLKGSTYKRELTEEQMKHVQNKTAKIAQKDNDFLNKGVKLKFPARQKAKYMDIIEKDVKWFKENQIVDYSFLVGIHSLPQS